MQATNISWCDLTWNPVRGCSRISPGCQKCFAEKMAARFSNYHEGSFPPKSAEPFAGFAEFRIVGGKREAHWTGKVELIEEKLLEPSKRRKWARKFADKHGRKPRCFANSMSDMFHEKLPDEAIDKIFAAMALCPEIDFLALTKRSDRLLRYFSDLNYRAETVGIHAEYESGLDRHTNDLKATWEFPLPNVWLAVSVEDQKRKCRIDHLRRTPAAVRFISAEPLIEDLGEVDLTGISMVITGGESGHDARPFDLAWARDLRDQCRAAGVAYFCKQLGSNPIEDNLAAAIKSDKIANIAALKHPHLQGFTTVHTNVGTFVRKWHRLKARNGDDPAEWPEDLRIQEFPESVATSSR